MLEVAGVLGRHLLALGWQVALVIGVVWALGLAFGERGAGARYRLWLLVLGRLLVPVVLVSPIGLLTSHERPVGPAVAPDALVALERVEARPVATQPIVESVPTAQVATSTFFSRQTLEQTVGIVWPIAALVFVIASVRRHRSLLRALRDAKPVTGQVAAYLEAQKRSLGPGTPVDTAIDTAIDAVVAPSDAWTSPALVGLLRPRIIVPRHVVDAWNEAAHGPLLVHELIHLRRRDPWVNLAVSLVRAVYCLHPMVWLATSCLLRDRERVCDDAVVRHLGATGGSYVRALCRHGLDLAARGRGPHPAPAIALARSRPDLVRRVRRLSAPGFRPLGPAAWIGALVLGGLALTLVAGPSGESAESEAATASRTGESAAWEEDLDHLQNLLRDARGPGTPSELALVDHSLTMMRTHTGLPADVMKLIAGTVYSAGPAEQLSAVTIWDAHLEAHPDDAAVLRNGALVVGRDDPERAARLFERSLELAPESFDSVRLLAEHRLESALDAALAGDFEESRRLRAAARPLLLDVVDLAPTAELRVLALGRAARTSFDLALFDEAEDLARRQLEEAGAIESSWAYGNALHVARLTLGEIALRRGDVEEAAEWLLRSADVPPSPQLQSFGPSMRLAAALLEHGQDAVVLDYLERTKAFWKSHRNRPDLWSSDIVNGRTPDFGAGLGYHI